MRRAPELSTVDRSSPAAASRWLTAVRADVHALPREHMALVLDRAAQPWRRAARALNAWTEANHRALDGDPRGLTWAVVEAAWRALTRLEQAVYGVPGLGTMPDRRATFGEHRAREERGRAEARYRAIWEAA